LRGYHAGIAEVIDGSTNGTTEQSKSDSAAGPFAIQKVKLRQVFYMALDLAQQFDLTDYLEYTGGFNEYHALLLFR
jgi:hypothetical protein